MALRNLSANLNIVSMDAERQKLVLTEMGKVYQHLYVISTTTNLEPIRKFNSGSYFAAKLPSLEA